MNNEKIFDKVIFDVGDRVIRKYKELHTKPEIVCKSIMVKNLDGFTYNVIFFESNPNDFHVAWEYEPANPEQLLEYNKVHNISNSKIKVKSEKTVRKELKPLKLKPND
jgi:hypothetical protein